MNYFDERILIEAMSRHTAPDDWRIGCVHYIQWRDAYNA